MPRPVSTDMATVRNRRPKPGPGTDARTELPFRPIADTLRSAIADSGLSVYALATASGIDIGTLYRFIRRECGMKLATVDLLFAVLGLRMTRGTEGAADPGPPLPSDALLAAIKASGLTASKLSSLSGVHHQAIRKFVGGLLGLELVSADRIAAALGLRVVQGTRPTLAPPERPGDAGRPILDAILAEIEARGLDAGELALLTGLRKDKLERLIGSSRDVKLAVADLICEAIGVGFIWKTGEPAAVPSVAIRSGIEASGLQRLRKLGQLSGVVYQSIHGFMSGMLGLELATADKLAAALGLAAARGQVARPPDHPAPVDPSIPYLDGLRAKVKETGLSVYALSRRSGLAQPSITRFLKGENNLVTASIAKLAAAVGFDPRQTETAPVVSIPTARSSYEARVSRSSSMACKSRVSRGLLTR